MTLNRRVRNGRTQQQVRETAPNTVILANWTSVYPLSRSPAERIERDVGSAVPNARLRSILNEYVRTINTRLDPALQLQIGGDVVGPSEFAGDPVLELFTAVLGTDVHAIIARQSTR